MEIVKNQFQPSNFRIQKVSVMALLAMSLNLYKFLDFVNNLFIPFVQANDTSIIHLSS